MRDKILKEEILPGSHVKVYAINGEIKFEIEKQTEVILEKKEEKKLEKEKKEISKLEEKEEEKLDLSQVKEYITHLLKSYKENLKQKGINLRIDKI
jgi:phosphomannomutase